MSRLGNFTSSNIWKLMTNGRNKEDFGKPALTYINEKRMEVKLGRDLNSDHNAKPTGWGQLVEQFAFDKLPIDYKFQAKTRYTHPTIDYWSGMPDAITDNCVMDIKCPWTMKSFCEGVEFFGDLELFKAELPEYYWQLVSNAEILEKEFAEIIYFAPYQKDLVEIRELANNYEGDPNKVAFVNWASDEELPFIPDTCTEYKDLNVFRFKVPESDKEALRNRVKMAIIELYGEDKKA